MPLAVRNTTRVSTSVYEAVGLESFGFGPGKLRLLTLSRLGLFGSRWSNFLGNSWVKSGCADISLTHGVRK